MRDGQPARADARRSASHDVPGAGETPAGTRTRPHTRTHALVAGALAALLGFAPGCDRVPSGGARSGAAVEDAAALAIVSTSFDGGVAAPDGPLEITFDDALPANGPAAGAVRLEDAATRRAIAFDASAEGRVLRVTPDLGVRGAAVRDMRIVVEGGSSPRALVSAAGRRLARRLDATIRIDGPARDLEGPALVATRPADGATDASPGGAVELRFSEPLAEAPSDAVTLTADGARADVHARLSSDRRTLVVRPRQPLPSGARIDVRVSPWVTDRAGNPLDAASRSGISYSTRQSRVREIVEEFASDEMADPCGTDSAWAQPCGPGLLVARAGTRCAIRASDHPLDLGERSVVRFQVLAPAAADGALASALRLRFARCGDAQPVRAASVEIGAFPHDGLLPSFEANRRAAAPAVVADAVAPRTWTPDASGGAWVDVPFDFPLLLQPGRTVLLDVMLRLDPSARLAARLDDPAEALVEGGGRPRLRPAAALVVAGGAPSALSHWYDAGTDRLRWTASDAAFVPADRASRAAIEFQACPADAAGAPDETVATPWEPDVALLPGYRFVRFRVRFTAPGDAQDGPALDRVTMRFAPAR
ncbi:MAG: hypothetical protein HMLKMBBP_02887 [Planctomycetes bacterium]|nr:hypothetical protein [Planctomycetota bacterium]